MRLGLIDGAAVAEAFEDFSRRLGAGPALLQRKAGPGAQLILGARRDPLFGPIVMAGLGGVWTEILDDVALRLAPIEAEEARTMLDELKGQKFFPDFGAVGQWSSWVRPIDRRPVAMVLRRHLAGRTGPQSHHCARR